MENLKKKIEVVMLPSSNGGKIGLNPSALMNKPNLYYFEQGAVRSEVQHLYFLSDEKIKEGDLCIQNGNWLCKITCNRDLSQSNLKKIIVSTDKSLNIPQPSQAFVKVFIEEWNKGNKIQWVMVDYQNKWVNRFDENMPDQPILYEGIELKVDKNNYITITKVKDSWSREEYEQGIRKVVNDLFVHVSRKESNGLIPLEYDWTAKWIEENL